VARRTKVSPDEAFLTGLMHGIDLVAGWHAQIGKAVLENWGFAQQMCEAVGEQGGYDRRFRREPDLTDILIVSTVLAEAMKAPAPRDFPIEGITAFATIGLQQADCAAVLALAEEQLASLHDALGC
jgi:HD-like signal output (HDOD) protein